MSAEGRVEGRAPFFSVVVPVRDGGQALVACLAALRRSSFTDWELWVVDDGSVDESPAVAAAAGAGVLTTGGGRGPGAARNVGAARARGEFLFFVDADCAVHAETLTLARARLIAGVAGSVATAAGGPVPDALFGSYDDAPAAPGLVSQYKNLLHHFVHQQGREEAATFWAGCGVVRRTVFLAAGGFDERRWARPAIEDIELGYRLRQRGSRIVLAREVQVKHLKRWTLGSLVRSDVRDRALPWARLLLERRALHADLNIDHAARWSAGLALLGAAGAVGTLAGVAALLVARYAGLGVDGGGLGGLGWLGWLGSVPVVAGAALLAINRGLYGFFLRRRGALFAVGAIGLHWLYLLYSAGAAGVALIGHLGRGPRAAAVLAGHR